ncbi:C-GCAxxG-C-C family protein [Treponema sp.]|uniref:C-GCAxxG-C-C family protein n=1 Tax=Treponema sp. TaxID=166 RepID=UPI003F0DA96E
MISAEEARQKAAENFTEGFNCAQSVLEVFCTELGIDRDFALKAAQAFGGGTCRLREMCGAVNGMMLALSIKEGVSDPKDKNSKDSLYKTGQDLCGKFKAKNGSFICRELLGISPLGDSQKFLRKNSVEGNASEPVSEQRTESYYKKRPCKELCADAAEIFAEYINSK